MSLKQCQSKRKFAKTPKPVDIKKIISDTNLSK